MSPEEYEERIKDFIAKENDPAEVYLMLVIGYTLYMSFSQYQPKRLKVFRESQENDLPFRFKLQAMLVHDSDWVAGQTDELEGEGSLSTEALRPWVPDVHDGALEYAGEYDGAEVEVEHVLHGNQCAIRSHDVGVPCDCGAASWFEIMPRKDYEAMLSPAEVSERDAFANSDSHFGVCPECKKTDGYFNLRSDHYFVCHRHRGYWYAGSNLFSQWKDEPSAVHEKNRKLLETYTQVEPFLPPAATSGIAPALTKIATSDFIDDTQELPF